MMVPSGAAGMEIPQGLNGLGEYPGYYCYDKDRPSWLPYWLDDLTESGCKWSPKTVAGNLYHCITGAPDCGTPSAAQQDPTKSGPGVAAAGEEANTPTCNGFGQAYDPASNQCVFNPLDLSVVLTAAGALGLLLLLRR